MKLATLPSLLGASLLACASPSVSPLAPPVLVAPAATHEHVAPVPEGAPAKVAAAAIEPVGPVRDLLRAVPSQLAVSSTVKNPFDFPEHLADGRSDTAWSGASGDLHAWIAFRVPADAHVTSITMSAGFDKVSESQKAGRVDLFRANHRIRRVKVTRNGALLKEVPLDPEVRAPQTIPLDVDGGEFRVEVVETRPGTNRTWREIVVSEFAVAGVPGKERRPAGEHLQTAVGSLDEPSALIELEGSPVSAPLVADFDSFCQDYLRDAQPSFLALRTRVENGSEPFEVPRPVTPPFCYEVPLPVPFVPSGAWKAARVVRNGYGAESDDQLVVQLERGWIRTPISWRGRTSVTCNTWRSEGLDELRVQNGHLVAITTSTIYDWKLEIDKPAVAYEVLVPVPQFCQDDGSTLVCKFTPPELDFGEKRRKAERRPWATIPWKGRKFFHVTAEGDGILR